MKKSIFLFFAAILCATNAWAWCGNSFITVNGLWCTGSNSYVHDGGKFHGKDLGTLTTLELGGEFQVWPSSTTAGTLCYKIDDGTENSISLPKTGTEGNNSKHSGSGAVDLSGLAGGSHSIAVWFKHGSDIDNNGGSNFVATFTIAAATPDPDPDPEPEPEPVADVTVHFINSVEWAAVACHHWVAGGSGTSWPGDVLSKTDEIAGYDVYTATFTGEHTSCIFNNNNNGKQTGDLIVEDGKYYEVNTNTWYADKAAAEAALATPIPDETVYLINTGNWSKAMIYTWNGVGGTAWPGVEMTPTGETIEGYAVYSYTAKQGGQANLLFQESADVNKTGDLTWEAGKYYAPSKNKWYDTKEAAAEALAAPVVDVYTVVGSSTELGLEWNPAKEANDMEKQDDGSYKKVYNNVELTANVEWKIAKNDDWWDGPSFNNQNNTLPIAKSGIYNVTFVLSADLATATAEAELLEETNAVADCYISGNAALTGGAGWAGNEFQMEYTEATETYSYTFTGLAAATSYELKVVLGGVWYGFAELVDPAPANVSEGTDNSIAFKMAAAGDVVVTYNVEAGITLSGNFAEPVTYVTVADATVTTGQWSIDLAGTWEERTVTIKLWQDNVQGFGEYAANADTGYTCQLGNPYAELTPTTAGVYADNGDGTFTFTATMTDAEGGIYNISVTGAIPADEPEVPTALDNVTTTVAPVKAIVNGQLVIVKDGVKYNAQGAVVK